MKTQNDEMQGICQEDHLDLSGNKLSTFLEGKYSKTHTQKDCSIVNYFRTKSRTWDKQDPKLPTRCDVNKMAPTFRNIPSLGGDWITATLACRRYISTSFLHAYYHWSAVFNINILSKCPVIVTVIILIEWREIYAKSVGMFMINFCTNVNSTGLSKSPD